MTWYGFAIVICDQRWLGMRREDRVVCSNSVVESKVALGVKVQLHPGVGAPFSSRVGRSKKGRGTWDSGSARTVRGPVKEMLSEGVERCKGWERENWLLCWNWSRFRTSKAERAAGTVNGGKEADGFCTSAIKGGVNW